MLSSICITSTMERSRYQMKVEVTFKDVFDAKNEDELYEAVLEYLLYVVKYQDLTAFNFGEVKEE
jgi:hypothetical protein